VIHALILLLLVATQASGQQPIKSLDSARAGEVAGELVVYGMETQIGVAGRREFTNHDGRLLRTVFYRRRQSLLSTPTKVDPAKEDLIPAFVVVYKYDEQARLIAEEHCDRSFMPSRILRHEYDSEGRQIRSWWEESDGIRRYEMRWSRDRGPGSKASDLYFDDTGTFLVGIRGELPKDIDLPHGWGMPVDGLSCGVVLSRERGPLSTLAFTVNVKNTSASMVSIDVLSTPQVILRDAAGRIVPPRGRFGEPGQLYGQFLSPGEAGMVYPAYELKTVFPRLPPGRYRMHIQERVPERNIVLVSNELIFEVEADSDPPRRSGVRDAHPDLRETAMRDGRRLGPASSCAADLYWRALRVPARPATRGALMLKANSFGPPPTPDAATEPPKKKQYSPSARSDFAVTLYTPGVSLT
jgi:hypothetical protein